jgi:exonuclease SbcC
MRVLSVRGENLASLYGPFELPLDRGPIAEAGLFSISGPTGAGKSTLMDALCLALFGRTPRLGDRGRSVMIGRPDDDASLLVDASDVRNILSRGAGAGRAEVDFEGVDGGRYRACWSVNRARGRANGRLQQPRMVLTDLASGQAVASGLAAVPERVARLVGYSFDEFKRAVVLPQFEFTAFLEAKPDERAAILERVTGTDVYTRLSIAAHQRAGAEGEKLRLLEERAAAVRLLTDEERREQMDRAAALARAQEEARTAARVASDAMRWHATAEELCREVADAESQVSRSAAALADGEPIRAELRSVEGAQELRPLHEDGARTAREREEAAARLASTEARLAAARDGSSRAGVDREAAEIAANDAAARLERARPQIARARELDAGIAEAKRRANAAEAAGAAARDDAARAEAALAELRRSTGACESSRDRAAAWLGDHADRRTLAAEWPRWQAALRDHAAIAADLGRAEALLGATRDGLRAAEARKAALEREAREREAEHAHREERWRYASGAAARDDATALQRRAEELADRRDALKALANAAAIASEAREARRAAAEAARADAEALEAAGREVNANDARIAASEAALEAARAALDRIAAALRLEEHRGSLVDGEPCPLCGATAHPYAMEAPPRSLHRQQADAVAGAEAQLAGLREAGADAARRVAKLEARLERLRGEEERQAAALAAAEGQYEALREGGEVAGVPAQAADGVEELATLLAAVDADLCEAREEQQRAIARGLEANAALRDLDEARRELDEARRALANAEREVDRGAKDAERHEGSLRDLTRRRDGVEGDLAPALAFREGWLGAARDDPAAFSRECGEVVGAHAEREADLKAAEERLASLRGSLEGASARAEEKRRQARDAADAAAREAEALASLAGARADVLGGRPTDGVERELRGGEQRARERLDLERRRLADADRRLAAVEQEAAGGVERLEQARDAATAAEGALAAALGRRGLDRRRLAALLARDGAWIESSRRALSALDKALHEAEARLSERRRRLRDHESTGRPGISKEEAAERAKAAGAQERGAADALAEVHFRLREDERGRGEAARLAAERDAQREVAGRWRGLAAVIGSADGKKLRTFAQGLTLDALLLHASHHLRYLAPRYALARVPGADLDLQVVDHDLGAEVRSVNGLSGGETFLVSLALALGLASLSTRATQARTLFIDEGFGTLDRDTLEKAMAALDGLRATGRTVGIISHVPELHERLGASVRVERVSAGRSRVVLPEESAARAERLQALSG